MLCGLVPLRSTPNKKHIEVEKRYAPLIRRMADGRVFHARLNEATQYNHHYLRNAIAAALATGSRLQRRLGSLSIDVESLAAQVSALGCDPKASGVIDVAPPSVDPDDVALTLKSAYGDVMVFRKDTTLRDATGEGPLTADSILGSAAIYEASFHAASSAAASQEEAAPRARKT